MIGEERRARIYGMIKEDGFVLISDLASTFSVSGATIRRDLELMEKDGRCIRKHGGAIDSFPGRTVEHPYELKKLTRTREKELIAQEALSLIENGETIILDSGSTTFALARIITQIKRLTVITTDLIIAKELTNWPNIHVVCSGGITRPNVYSMYGGYGEQTIRQLRVDKSFLGTDAIHLDGTVGNVNIEEVGIKHEVIRAGDMVVLLADSSKFETKGIAKVCNLNEIDVLITDSNVKENQQAMLMLSERDLDLRIV